MEEDIVFLDKSIHINKFMNDMVKVGVDEETGEDQFESFDLESDRFKHILERLIMSIDGSIMGVHRSSITPYLSDPNVRGIRFGTKKMPKKFKIEGEDDLFRLLAILTPLDEA